MSTRAHRRPSGHIALLALALSLPLGCAGRDDTPEDVEEGEAAPEEEGRQGPLEDALKDRIGALRIGDMVRGRAQAVCGALAGDLAQPPIAAPWRPDHDGDGFGAEGAPSPSYQPGYTQVRGDCDDGDSAIFPGAKDHRGDWIDADCGGSDGPDVSLGLREGGPTSLAAAIADAAEGATLWIGPGAYPASGAELLGRGLRIAATHGPEVTAIEGQGGGILRAEGASLMLADLTLRGGQRSEGGALQLIGGRADLRGLVFVGNEAARGGALFMEGGEVHLGDVTFTDNVATSGSLGRGGGLYLGSGTLIADRVRFEGNRAVEGGGAYIGGGIVRLSASVGEGNGAEQGGGLRLAGGRVSLTRVDLRENSAEGSGGGLFVSGHAKLSLEGVRLLGNRALQGGGLAADGDIDRVKSYDDGWPSLQTSGGICVQRNVAEDGGGAHFARGASLLYLALLDNEAIRGGGAFLDDTRYGILWVEGNRAEVGGGIYALNARVRSVRALENSATDGAGIYAEGSFQANGITLTENHAARRGGGIFVEGTGAYPGPTFLVQNAWIGGNDAVEAGGGIYVDDAEGTLDPVALVGNRAAAGGGAMVDGGIVALTRSVVVSNIGAEGAGVMGIGPFLELSVLDSILAFNEGQGEGYNLRGDGLGLVVSSSTIFGGLSGAASAEGILDEDPRLKAVPPAGTWAGADLHLRAISPCIDSGASRGEDLDMSPPDQGIFAGNDGRYWDVDFDWVYAHFWPGAQAHAPWGFDASHYDTDDFNPRTI